MNRVPRVLLETSIALILLITAIGFVSAQKMRGTVGPVLAEDTSINPHDFTDEHYAMHGILAKGIIDRRTGADGLSVFGSSSNPLHTNVRVIVTVPAYDQHGALVFWYPLGDLQENGFTEDKIGWSARETASNFPIYVFPDSKILDYRVFSNNRQAPLMDNSFSMTNGEDANPLGIREVIMVNYTEKAFGKESVEMMEYFLKKNGAAADDTPMIKTVDDLQFLLKHEMIKTESGQYGLRFTISTPIYNPTKGVIAQDAFLWSATKDGKPLVAEALFVWQFHCLQKTGWWCE